jgi:hypothetical protein
VENAAPVEIDKGGPSANFLFDDFHQVLGKSSAKNASLFPHFPQRAPSPIFIPPNIIQKPGGTTIG